MEDETVKIEESPLKPVDGIAYDGKLILQAFGWCIVDLSKMEVAPQIPLLNNHANEPSKRLGVVNASIVDDKLKVNGVIDTKSCDGFQIVEEGKNIQWQLSMGARIISRHVAQQDTVINNNPVKAGTIIVDKCILREVSVVAVGEALDTQLNIVASFEFDSTDGDEIVVSTPQETEISASLSSEQPIEKENSKMELDQIKQDAVARIKDINAIQCSFDATDLKLKAITEDKSVEEVQAMINTIEAELCKLPQKQEQGVELMTNQEDVIKASLMMATGVNAIEIKEEVGEQAFVQAKATHGLGLKDACALLTNTNNVEDTISAAFSTNAVSSILADVFKTHLINGYNKIPAVADVITETVNLSDFKKIKTLTTESFNNLEKVQVGGKIKNGALSYSSADLHLETYGQIFSITRQDIYNDDSGVYSNIPAKFGYACKQTLDSAVASVLDASTADVTGASTALSADSLNTAIDTLVGRKGSNKKPLGLQPKFLVVPPALYSKALNLVESTEITGANTEKGVLCVANRLGIQVVLHPYLTDTDAWYLMADPQITPALSTAYLRGVKTPIVQKVQLHDVDGISYKAIFDFGVALSDPKAMYKAKGKA